MTGRSFLWVWSCFVLDKVLTFQRSVFPLLALIQWIWKIWSWAFCVLYMWCFVFRGNVITGSWTGRLSPCTKVRAAPSTTRLDSKHSSLSVFWNSSISSLSPFDPSGNLPVWGAAGPRALQALHTPVAGSQRPLLRVGDGLSDVLRGGRRPRAHLGDGHPSGSDARPEQQRRPRPGRWVGNSNIHFIRC